MLKMFVIVLDVLRMISASEVYFRYGIQLFDPKGYDGEMKCRITSRNVGKCISMISDKLL